jgi:hypothetical protein
VNLKECRSRAPRSHSSTRTGRKVQIQARLAVPKRQRPSRPTRKPDRCTRGTLFAYPDGGDNHSRCLGAAGGCSLAGATCNPVNNGIPPGQCLSLCGQGSGHPTGECECTCAGIQPALPDMAFSVNLALGMATCPSPADINQLTSQVSGILSKPPVRVQQPRRPGETVSAAFKRPLHTDLEYWAK